MSRVKNVQINVYFTNFKDGKEKKIFANSENLNLYLAPLICPKTSNRGWHKFKILGLLILTSAKLSNIRFAFLFLYVKYVKVAVKFAIICITTSLHNQMQLHVVGSGMTYFYRRLNYCG